MPSNLFDQLRKELAPPKHMQTRVQRKIHARMEQRLRVPIAFAHVQRALTPSAAVRKNIWGRILERMDGRIALGIFERLREFLTPDLSVAVMLRERTLSRLSLAPTSAWFAPFKWAAALVVVGMLVRVSPFFFIASPTIANSEVTLVPTRGEIYVSMGDLWQPVRGELVLEPGIRLKTDNGEASILFHDDGVIRMDNNTILTLHDTEHRMGLAPDILPTMTLFTGRVWVRGLVPPHVRGLTVTTSYGHVTVQEGSVVITEDDVVDVQIFDRRATVSHDGHDIVLVAGERTQLWEGNVPLVKKIPAAEYEQHWFVQNIERDAVHRREIAQLQQERRAAAAGILPTSPLAYSVKRIAEKVDVFLTLDGDTRTQKRIEQADTRFNEAAALLASDLQEDAAVPLAEYRQTLLALAESADESVLTEFLLGESLARTSSDVAAVLPDDDAAYLLKRAVLEASAAVDGMTTADAIAGIFIVDTLTTLRHDVEQGNVHHVEEEWSAIQPYLAILEGDALPPEVHKEIMALLAQFAAVVSEHRTEIGLDDSLFFVEVFAYLPPSPTQPTVRALTEDDISTIAQSIRDRIFLYHMKQSRLNQLTAELRAIDGHPDEGRILRRLYVVLPDGPEEFPDRIRREITRLRWDQAGDIL